MTKAAKTAARSTDKVRMAIARKSEYQNTKGAIYYDIVEVHDVTPSLAALFKPTGPDEIAQDISGALPIAECEDAVLSLAEIEAAGFFVDCSETASYDAAPAFAFAKAHGFTVIVEKARLRNGKYGDYVGLYLPTDK